jgi:hypothetical protein
MYYRCTLGHSSSGLSTINGISEHFSSMIGDLRLPSTFSSDARSPDRKLPAAFEPVSSPQPRLCLRYCRMKAENFRSLFSSQCPLHSLDGFTSNPYFDSWNRVLESAVPFRGFSMQVRFSYSRPSTLRQERRRILESLLSFLFSHLATLW